MKYAILSDIHANLMAVERVLEDAKTQGCTDMICLGDIIGNGQQPKECLDLIFVRDSVVRGGTFTKFQIQPGASYFINVGSVGQLRDGTIKPTYVTYDLNSHVVELRRLEEAD